LSTAHRNVILGFYNSAVKVICPENEQTELCSVNDKHFLPTYKFLTQRSGFDMAAKSRKSHKNKLSGILISIPYNEQKANIPLFTDSSGFKG
jgi:hypothetical protein